MNEKVNSSPGAHPASGRGSWYWIEDDEKRPSRESAKPPRIKMTDTYPSKRSAHRSDTAKDHSPDASPGSSGPSKDASDSSAKSRAKDSSELCMDQTSDRCSTTDCSDDPALKVHACKECGHEELLHAIALEQVALANVINAAAEKSHAVAKSPMTPFTPDELIAFQQSLAKVLEMVVAKEALLLKRLRLILAQCERCPKCRKAQSQDLSDDRPESQSDSSDSSD